MGVRAHDGIKAGIMIIAWWLHRIIIIGLTGFCFFGGGFIGLDFISYISRLPGNNIPDVLLIALMPLCALIGAFIPQMIFRKFIHAKCPVDGYKMIFERIRVYPEGYHRRVGKLVSRYRCEVCGLTK